MQIVVAIVPVFRPWLVLLGALLVTPLAVQAGPSSRLYMTVLGGYPYSAVAVMQGDEVVDTWQTGWGEWALAVGDTVRTVVYMETDLYQGGREYGLDGTPTGVTYGQKNGMYDGTTDGLYNYAVHGGTGEVYRFRNDWSGGEVLFTVTFQDPVSPHDGNSIAYDPADGSIWILEHQNASLGTTLAQYTLNGALVRSFSTGRTQTHGLALDPVDGTLWVGEDTALWQFTRDGAVVGGFQWTRDNPAPGTIRGLEFANGPFARDEDCDNGIDDDLDGLVDTADPDCTAPPPPPETVGLLVRCMHSPIYPQAGEQVAIRAWALDRDGETVTADRVEIVVGDLANVVTNSSNQAFAQHWLTPPGGSLAYGCRAVRGTEVAQSWHAAEPKLRYVDVGSLNNPDWKAVPVIYHGPVSEKLDIVFFHDDDQYTSYLDPDFLTDVHDLVAEGLWTIPWFVENQWAFNIWIATADTANADPKDNGRCRRDAPDRKNRDYGYRDAGGIVHKEGVFDCRDNAGAGRLFTIGVNPLGLQVLAHEMGHQPFGLSDEYCDVDDDGVLICDSFYFPGLWIPGDGFRPPYPNLFAFEQQCREEAVHRAYEADDCRTIKPPKVFHTLWIGEPNFLLARPWESQVRDLMQQSGGERIGGQLVDRYRVGPSELDRMNWLVGRCLAGRC